MRCIWDAHWNFLSRSVLNLGTRYDEKWSWLLVQHQLMLQRNRYHIHHNYVLGTWPMNVEGDVSQSIPQSCRAQGEVTCVESREHRSLHHKLVRDWPLRSEALKDIGWDFTWELDVYRGYLSARIWHDLTYSSQDAWRRTYASVRLIVKKLLKLQKTLQKTLPTVYSRIYRIFYRKCSQRGDFGVSSTRILCPLEYILSVGERFWNFLFPGNPKKTPTFFTISLASVYRISVFRTLLHATVRICTPIRDGSGFARPYGVVASSIIDHWENNAAACCLLPSL